jgi:hypothetical protein
VDNNLYVDRASIFIDSYFDSLHYIHPIIDKDDFMGRAKDMWLGHSSNSSFLALYFSVMSLGALVGVLDNQQLPRQSRVEWSRKLFQEAQNCLDMTKFSNDLDIVQCLFLMV